jgi:HSP20 family protein
MISCAGQNSRHRFSQVLGHRFTELVYTKPRTHPRRSELSDVEKEASDTKDNEKERGSSLALRRPDDYFREMDRMLDDFRRRFESSIFPFVDPWSNLGRKLLDMPESRHACGDLIDAGNEYRVMVEVPGISKDKLNIMVSNRQIRIEGEAQNNAEQKDSGYVRRERGSTQSLRRLSLSRRR